MARYFLGLKISGGQVLGGSILAGTYVGFLCPEEIWTLLGDVRGFISNETVVMHRWESGKDCLILSTELKTKRIKPP